VAQRINPTATPGPPPPVWYIQSKIIFVIAFGSGNV
jgi:hypothetical protein